MFLVGIISFCHFERLSLLVILCILYVKSLSLYFDSFLLSDDFIYAVWLIHDFLYRLLLALLQCNSSFAQSSSHSLLEQGHTILAEPFSMEVLRQVSFLM